MAKDLRAPAVALRTLAAVQAPCGIIGKYLPACQETRKTVDVGVSSTTERGFWIYFTMRCKSELTGIKRMFW